MEGNTEEIHLKQILQVRGISKEEKNNSINSISLDYTLKCIKQYKYVCMHTCVHICIFQPLIVRYIFNVFQHWNIYIFANFSFCSCFVIIFLLILNLFTDLWNNNIYHIVSNFSFVIKVSLFLAIQNVYSFM